MVDETKIIAPFREALKHLVNKIYGVSQRELSERSCIDYKYLNHIYHGRRNGSEDIRRRIAEALGWEYEKFLDLGRRLLAGENVGELHAAAPGAGARIVMDANTPPDDEFTRVVVMESLASAGLGYVPVYEHEGYQIAFRTEWLRQYGPVKRFFALFVKGDSMEPTLLTGDIILVRRGEPTRNGCLVVAKTADGDLVVKRAFRKTKGYALSSDNPAYEPIDVQESDIYGQVIWMGRELE